MDHTMYMFESRGLAANMQRDNRDVKIKITTDPNQRHNIFLLFHALILSA